MSSGPTFFGKVFIDDVEVAPSDPRLRKHVHGNPTFHKDVHFYSPHPASLESAPKSNVFVGNDLTVIRGKVVLGKPRR